MKSLLLGGALSAFCLLSIGGIAGAQYGSYSPSMLPAAPQSQPMRYPTATSAQALRTPAYRSSNDVVGSPLVESIPQSSYGYGTPIAHSGSGCGGCGKCDDCSRCGNWFGSASALLMKPDRANPYLFSYDRSNEAIQLTNTQDAEIEWGSGFDVRFGRYFNCGANAVEVVYWGLFPDQETTWSTTDSVASGDLDAILNFDDLNYNGVAANLFADDAEIHQLWHEQRYHNVEINLMTIDTSSCGGPGCGKCARGKCGDSRMQSRLLFGARWFKFNDRLLFGADPNDRQFTSEIDEIYYDIEVDNNLIGFQVGYEGEYAIRSGWTADYGIKFGVYGNNIDHTSQIGGAAGLARIGNGPNTLTPFYVDNKKTDLAFLGEANLGLEYQVNKCWTATFGYRAMAVTGVALPSNQIWPDLRGIQDVFQIDSNGSLILHGGYAGIEYNF